MQSVSKNKYCNVFALIIYIDHKKNTRTRQEFEIPYQSVLKISKTVENNI